jgi:hypothetical protein
MTVIQASPLLKQKLRRVMLSLANSLNLDQSLTVKLLQLRSDRKSSSTNQTAITIRVVDSSNTDQGNRLVGRSLLNFPRDFSDRIRRDDRRSATFCVCSHIYGKVLKF